MRAICLSAGRSSRLMPLTKNVHKSALHVSGWPILDWQMAAFLRAEISQVVVVAGHGCNEMCRLLERWKHLLDIDVVTNAEFDRKNMDFSVSCASRFFEEPILYFEGDLLLPPELLKKLAQSDTEIAIAASRTQRSQRADAVVRRVGMRLFLDCAEHGSLDISNSEGEFICAVALRARSAAALRVQLSSADFVGPMQIYSIFSRLMATEKTTLVDASDYPWIEIDHEQDLESATAVVAAFGFDPPLTRPLSR